MQGLEQIRLEDLNLKDFEDNPIDLSKGKRRLLTFRRNVDCPVCFHKYFDFSELSRELNPENSEIIIFTPSPSEKLKLALKGWEVDIKLVSDPEYLIYKKFYIEKSVSKLLLSVVRPSFQKEFFAGYKKFPNGRPKSNGIDTIMPAEFLFDENNKLHRSHFFKRINDGMDIETIRNFLLIPVAKPSTRKLQMS